MGLRVKDRTKPKLPPVASGVYMAVCVGVIDLGEQLCEYKEKKGGSYKNQVQFVWELVGETVEVDGEQKPRQLSRTFSVTASKKGNLIGFISGWNGTSYTEEQFLELDLFGQAGRACQLNVVLSDTGEYANVDSAIPLPKGIPAPQTDTPLILWNMDEWDDAAFAALPEWVQDRIKKSTQYQKQHAPEDALSLKTGEAPASADPAEEECPI